MHGKTIRLYLADGTPTGTLVAEIINWTGKVVVAPRSKLADLLKRAELQRSGVYLLVGENPGNLAKDMVYVGEGDEVRTRLLKHDQDEGKDFWTRTVVVTSKDENLTKAHIRYLESRLIELTKQSGRATLVNGTAPSPPPMPEPDVADMEFFLSQLQMILPVIGFTFTRPKASARGQSPGPSAAPEFIMEAVGAQATAKEVDGEFIVLKGSTARKDGVGSWTNYKALREALVSEGKLIESDDPGFLVFTEDVAFSSPSAAAAVVYAGNQNGRIAWKVRATGQTYKEWQETQLVEANLAVSKPST